MRAELGLTAGYKPWTRARPARATRGVPPSQRMHEYIDISWGSRAPKQRRGPWFADLSQCVSRCRGRDSIPCLTTSSLLFDFNREQLLVPSELLALHGAYFADVCTDAWAANARKGIARVGEGMFAPDIGCLLLALLLNERGPYWPT